MNLIAIPDLANYLPSYFGSQLYDKNIYKERRAFYEYADSFTRLVEEYR